MNQSVIINIISQISVGCMFSMIASTLINTIMRSWIRFKDSLYKDESYLTHTLPVTKNELYNSKFIQTFIFFFIGFIIILVSLFITYYSDKTWLNISNFVRNITNGLNMSTTFFIMMSIVIIFLEVFNIIQCGFLGIILGYRKSNNKLGFSVLFGFIAYLIAQTIVLTLVFIYGLFNPYVMELFKTATINIDVDAFKSLAVVSSILYLIIIFAMSIICKKVLNEGVNVE